jgi:hypothetical protein
MSTEQPTSSSFTEAEQIEAAFRKLTLLPDCEVALQQAIMHIESIDSNGKGIRPKNFSNADRKVTEAELKKLSDLANKLADHIEALHEPAITVMLDWSVRIRLVGDLRSTANKAAFSHTHIDALLPILADPSMLKKDEGGRRENGRAKATCEIIAYHYKRLTGSKPTLIRDGMSDDSSPKGPYFTLVEDIFKVLRLKESTEYYANLAIQGQSKNNLLKNG